MKRCPTCQKTFDDDKRFCQIDGTPLAAEAVEPDDPFKTVIGQSFNPPSGAPDNDSKMRIADSKSKDEDILQIPEAFDPMKTMVASDPVKKDLPSQPKEPSVQPEPPKFSEPSLNPPSFGDLSSFEKDKPQPSAPRKFDSPFSTPANDAPQFGSPFSDNAPQSGSPFENDKKENNPFAEKTPEKPFSPFKDQTTPLGEKLDPFQNSAFGLPPIPLDQSYTPPKPDFNPKPVEQNNFEPNNWTPPPAPVDGWQNQNIGANTPFQPPAAGVAGQNQTLGIVTLVLGIVSLICLGFLTGIPALITGYLALKNIKNDPVQYGGKVLAIIGMVLGALGILWSVLYVVFVIFAIIANAV